MAGNGEVLLDVIDRQKRLLQHGAILIAIVLLVAARFVVDVSGAAAAALIAAAAAMFAVAASVWQRWALDYEGNRIVVENNPFRGERLLVGGAVAAKGKLGITSNMRAIIATPSGPAEIVAQTEARLTSYRCRVRVVRGGASMASDAELLAELRRRGLG